MKNTNTLKKNYEFKNVLTNGKGYFGRYINIYIIKEKYTTNKIGIAVGKKTAKSVKRNLIKRWIREAYYRFESNLNESYRIVFVLKKNVDIRDLDFWKIKKDMEMLFKKAGII